MSRAPVTRRSAWAFRSSSRFFRFRTHFVGARVERRRVTACRDTVTTTETDRAGTRRPRAAEQEGGPRERGGPRGVARCQNFLSTHLRNEGLGGTIAPAGVRTRFTQKLQFQGERSRRRPRSRTVRASSISDHRSETIASEESMSGRQPPSPHAHVVPASQVIAPPSERILERLKALPQGRSGPRRDARARYGGRNRRVRTSCGCGVLLPSGITMLPARCGLL